MATTLTHYYVSLIPSEVLQAAARDWCLILKDYPSWAIDLACIWWVGEGNDKRRNKPMPGDIAARARFETGVVRVAEGAVRRFERSGALEQTKGDRVTGEAAERIIRESGINQAAGPKRFGGKRKEQ